MQNRQIDINLVRNGFSFSPLHRFTITETMGANGSVIRIKAHNSELCNFFARVFKWIHCFSSVQK